MLAAQSQLIKRIQFFWICFFIAPTFICAQSTVNALAGNSDSGNREYSIQWSVGQLISTTASTNSGLLLHGIHQPATDVSENEVLASLKKLKVTIYPNPVRTSFQILAAGTFPSERGTYTILSQDGRALTSNLPITDQAIDVRNLSQGVYFIKIISGNNVFTHKFIKQ